MDGGSVCGGGAGDGGFGQPFEDAVERLQIGGIFHPLAAADMPRHEDRGFGSTAGERPFVKGQQNFGDALCGAGRGCIGDQGEHVVEACDIALQGKAQAQIQRALPCPAQAAMQIASGLGGQHQGA